MTHVTCRLTAKNRDQLRNPTLGNRVWATFLFLYDFLSSKGGQWSLLANTQTYSKQNKINEITGKL